MLDSALPWYTASCEHHALQKRCLTAGLWADDGHTPGTNAGLLISHGAPPFPDMRYRLRPGGDLYHMLIAFNFTLEHHSIMVPGDVQASLLF